jgi:hypothetical protein
MSMDWLLRKVIVQSFRGVVCPVCIGRKRPRNALCFACFCTLPAEMKQALDRRFGEGFEEAREEAVQWLRDQRVNKGRGA